METAGLSCKDIKEAFPEFFKRRTFTDCYTKRKIKRIPNPCCYDCHEHPELPTREKGKLRNGWSYEVCCGMHKFILENKIWGIYNNC